MPGARRDNLSQEPAARILILEFHRTKFSNWADRGAGALERSRE
jgi:hypothetical protein